MRCHYCKQEMDDGQHYRCKMTFQYEEVKCPECGGEMVSRSGKFGYFWGCKKYPDCRGTRDSEGRSRAERNADRHYNYEEDKDFDRAQGKTTFRKGIKND